VGGERERLHVRGANRCPYCHDAVTAAAAKEGCRTCMAWHHAECWAAHGGCGACGAGSDPPRPPGAAAPEGAEPAPRRAPAAGKGRGVPPLTPVSLRDPTASARVEPRRCRTDGCDRLAERLPNDPDLDGRLCRDHAIAHHTFVGRAGLAMAAAVAAALGLLVAPAVVLSPGWEAVEWLCLLAGGLAALGALAQVARHARRRVRRLREEASEAASG